MIRLFLVDDHTIVLDGLRALLTGHSDITITGEAANGDELLELLRLKQPDIILMDISLPGTSGIELCRMVKERLPVVKVLFLSMYTSEEFVFNAVKAGASGYLPKNISQNELLQAIRTIYGGGDYFNEAISNIILKSFVRKSRNTEGQEEPGELLSKRELEILKLFAEGRSNSEISEQLFISIRTVESHKNHIMQKLNLKSPVDLIKFAIRHNIAAI
jgi:DNA-binding NarL/FixJ family response regulator